MNKASNRTTYGFIVMLGAVLGLCSMNSVLAFDFQALPGAVEMPVDVQAEIQSAWNGRSSRHEVRSRHRREDGTPLFANRLPSGILALPKAACAQSGQLVFLERG